MAMMSKDGLHQKLATMHVKAAAAWPPKRPVWRPLVATIVVLLGLGARARARARATCAYGVWRAWRAVNVTDPAPVRAVPV